jgi:FMN reductase
MERQIRVVGVGGSLGVPSRSLAALKIALSGAEAAGALTQLFDIRTLDVPVYDPAVEPPLRIRELADEVHCAHGLLWSSPLYHGTISGAFKNVLDWLQILSDRDPPYLTNKIIGLISVTGGVRPAGGEYDGVCGPVAARVGRAAGDADCPGLADLR